jgi:hypothetical protein
MTNHKLNSSTDIQIRRFFEIALEKWPLIVGISLLGALLGLVVSYLRPSLYETQATLGININYGITEPLELVVEDRALYRVQAILESDDSLARVIEKLPESLISKKNLSTPTDLREMIRLDRRLSEWDLVAIDHDPQVAITIAQAWSEVAIAVLNESSEHAWRAVALMGDESFNVTCILASTTAEYPEQFFWQCDVEPLDLDPEVLTGELQTEIALSRGMLPNISYELLKKPVLPSEPVIWARGPLILSGLISGMVVGFWLVVFRRR